MVQNKTAILNAFYRLRGIPHGYSKRKLRIASYAGLKIVFPIIEDPAFDDVWVRDVYQVYSPRDDHVIIDVGAHMGFFTLKFVTRARQVIAVEPDPLNFDFLKYNVIMNGVEDKVILCNLALGKENGKIFLDRSFYGFGRTKSTSKETKYSSQMKTLDTLVRERLLDSVGLVKIDTEGFELDVLQGAVETLKRHKPDLIIAAYHFPEEYVVLSYFLRKQDYKVMFYYVPLFLFGGKEIYLYATADRFPVG
jgi:FkbM family methyltransferase